MLKGKRVCKKIGMFFLVLFLFFRQSMFLAAKEPEKAEEAERTEIVEEKRKTELIGNLEQGGILFPYYSNLDELAEGIREKLAAPEENFTVYVPYLLIQSAEFDGLLKQLFPGVRAGNYYSSTVYSISISYSNQSDVGEGIAKLNIEVKRTDSKEEQEVVLKLVKEIAKEIEKNASGDYEKIKMAHDFLLQNVAYTAGYDGAYSALCLGKAVCNGYAAAFQLIMEELGIPCMMVCSNEINHVWNCVYLEGAWYNIDVTWDDSAREKGTKSYRYFLKSQEDFYGHGDVAFSTAMKSFVQNTALTERENGWKLKGNQRYYYMDGTLVTGWLLEQDNWYYFNEDGVMQTGWIKSAGKWYYLDDTGAMV